MKNVELKVTGGTLSDAEIQEYVNRGRENKPSQKLLAVDINVDGDYVDLTYRYDDRPTSSSHYSEKSLSGLSAAYIRTIMTNFRIISTSQIICCSG